MWGFRYGDYTKYSLLVVGKPKVGRDVIKFEVPLTILAKPFSVTIEGIDWFGRRDSETPTLFDVSSKFQKTYKVVSIDSDMESYKIRIKNTSNEDLIGVSVQLSGLQKGLFETAPSLTGFNTWKKGEEKEIEYKTKQDISAIVSVIEDNSQKSIRIQTQVSSDFF